MPHGYVMIPNRYPGYNLPGLNPHTTHKGGRSAVDMSEYERELAALLGPHCLTHKEICQKLKISRTTVQRMKRNGALPKPVTFAGGCVRFVPQQVAACLAGLYAKDPPPGPRRGRPRKELPFSGRRPRKK